MLYNCVYIMKLIIPESVRVLIRSLVKDEHERSKASSECFTLQDNFTEGTDNIMTNQVGTDMNEADGDDLLQYNPNRLLDTLIENLRLKNDAALSRALEVAPPVISKIRHHRLPVGASLLIRMHEVSDLSIRDLRYLMGDRRNKFRISDKQFKPKEGEPGQG